MKPEQQRIAIAEACGWTAREDIENFWRAVDASGNMTHELWMSESNVWEAGIPNYLNDLNAMHDAEKVLTKANWGGYAAELYRITDAHNHGISPNHHWLAVAFSTAAQRAEAFLRTIGKWEESK
jgi:hypothetical protein